MDEIFPFAKSIHLTINEIDTYSFTYTPNLEQELIIGFLCCKGYITHPSQVSQNDENPSHIHITIGSHEKITPVITPQNVSMSALYQLTSNVQEKAILFKETAITESVALCFNGELSYFAEDTSILNAYYKAIGAALLAETPLETGLLIVSSKIDTPMIDMTIKLGIPTIASRTAPTYLAYQQAALNNITLIGFARGKKCNVYTNKSFVRV